MHLESIVRVEIEYMYKSQNTIPFDWNTEAPEVVRAELKRRNFKVTVQNQKYLRVLCTTCDCVLVLGQQYYRRGQSDGSHRYHADWVEGGECPPDQNPELTNQIREGFAIMPKKVLIALPPAMLQQVDHIAQCEHRTRSDLIREALRRYLDNFRRTQGTNLTVSTIEVPQAVGTTLT